MMSVSKLKEKYEQLVKEPLPKVTSNEDGEIVFTLYQTEWLRILVVRSVKESQVISIEVEISLPRGLSDQKPRRQESNDEDVNGTLEIMIEHLRYMQRLQSEGFTLDIIRQDCLWTASKEFKKIPSQSLFKLLLPPKSG